jgi:hypothetical protein
MTNLWVHGLVSRIRSSHDLLARHVCEITNRAAVLALYSPWLGPPGRPAVMVSWIATPTCSATSAKSANAA